MANIVNTPIVMYVKEHTLELDGDAAPELMEFNSYPIKIYTNENLDGCKLVKKLQNNQQLVEVADGDLIRDVKLLLRSKNNDGETNSTKAWWVYLENLNDPTGILEEITDPTDKQKTEAIEIIIENGNYYESNSGNKGKKIQLIVDKIYLSSSKYYLYKGYSIYGGTVKAYDYEYSPTILKGADRRAEFKIVELGQLQIYFNDDKFDKFTVYKNPTVNADEGEIEITNDMFTLGSILTKDFQDVPQPLPQQLSLEIPESIEISQLNLGQPGASFKLNDDIVLENIVLNNTSYDEDEGFYYYQIYIDNMEKIDGTTISSSSSSADAEEVKVNCEIDLVCKVNENNFNDYILEAKIILTPEISPRELIGGEISIRAEDETEVKIEYDSETTVPSLSIPEMNIIISENEYLIPQDNPITLNDIELQKESEDTDSCKYQCEIDYIGLGYSINDGTTSKTINKNFNLKATVSIEINKEYLIPETEKDENGEDVYKKDNFGNFQSRILSISSSEIQITNGIIKEIIGEYESLKNETAISTQEENVFDINYGTPSYIEDDFELEDVLGLESADDYNNVYTLQSDYIVDEYSGAGLNEFVLGLRHIENGNTTYITNAVRFMISPSIEHEKWAVQDYSSKTFYYATPTLDNAGKIIGFTYDTEITDESGKVIETKTLDISKDSRNICINKSTISTDASSGKSKLKMYVWDSIDGNFNEISILGVSTTSTPSSSTTE